MKWVIVFYMLLSPYKEPQQFVVQDAAYASQTQCEAAVRAAAEGKSGFMVKLVRIKSSPYEWVTALQPLGDIANVEHFIPRDWITADGLLPNEKFIEYAQPLVEGALCLPTERGLPKFAKLEKSRIAKKLAAR